MHRSIRSVVAARNRAAASGNTGVRAYATAHKDITFGDEGRAAMGRGVNILAKAVAVTLGPKGRNVAIEQAYGAPKITKDGVTVAKAIQLEDKLENLGAKLVQDVANKTNDVAGDGTTTATVLTRAIFSEGLKSIASGVNPMDLRKGVQAAVEATISFLRQHSTEITTADQICQVATISANGDEKIGQMISDAMAKVGKDGVITVQEGKLIEDELSVTEGMRFDRGFISPYFVTDAKNQKVEFENPYVLIAEQKISMVQDIVPALEVVAQQRRPLLIIAEDVEGEALAALILNKLRGQLQVAAVKAPGFGDNRKNILADMATLTGATVFSQQVGASETVEKVTAEHLGSIAACTITKDDTVFLSSTSTAAANPEREAAVHSRAEAIREQIANTTSEYEREKLQERLAKLTGGVAVLKVGGASEVEVGEKKDRVVDALNATRAAVAEGIIPGGGSALVKAVPILTAMSQAEANYDQRLGIQIVAKAIQAPLRTIVDNAGGEGAVVVGQVLAHATAATPGATSATSADLQALPREAFTYGYNAATGRYVDMMAEGIVDPVKVTRTALMDASSVASLLSTTEAMITEAPVAEPAMPAAAGMGGMPGMGGMGGMM